MKIISLEAQNVKRLRAVRIEPDGSLVVIGGRNGAGKTSVLDAIAYALGGKSLCPSRPIRDGEKSASARVDLGEFIVERTWTEKGSYLKVKTAEGFEAPSPQSILDKLTGQLAFDPLAFTTMPPRDQVEELKALVGLDFTDLDAKRAELYADRTGINREAKRLEGQLAGMPEVEAPDTEVSVADLMAELKAAQEHNGRRQNVRHRWKAAQQEHSQITTAIADCEAQLRRLKKQLADVRVAAEEAGNTLAACHSVDTAQLEQQIAQADEVNARVRQNRERARIIKALMKAKEDARAATAMLEELDAAKRRALAGAAFPVEGLSFDEDAVFYNGIPFDQASSAEQLRVSVAMGLAANPELRVLLVRDGSLLDEDNLRLMAEMAEEADAQVWLERVGAGEEVSVLIEDGSVVNELERVTA